MTPLDATLLGALAVVPLAGIALIGGGWAAQRSKARAAAAERDALARQSAEQQRDLARSSQALRLTEAQLAGIIDTASAAILTVDAAQTIVIANEAAALMFGVPREQLIGSTLERLIPARFRDDHAQMNGRFTASADGRAARIMGVGRDVLALRADGQEFPIEAAVSCLRMGEQAWFTVVLQDVSERRRADAALRAGAWKLEAALSSMDEAVFIADAQGHSWELNQAFATFYRFADRADCLRAFAEHPEFLEVTLPDGAVVPPEQWVVRRALRGESASNLEFGLRRKDTGEHWIGSYSFAPIRAEDGGIVGAVTTSRDVTAMRAAQLELARSQADLRRLIDAQDRIQEEERKRIARELHDDLQQTLAVIRIDLGSAVDQLGTDTAGIATLIAEADRLAMAAITSTRRIVNDLRPAMLEELGLVAAMRTMIHQFAERSGTACVFEPLEDVEQVLGEAPALTTCLYRVTQEALNNIAKHAHARAAQVRLAQVGPGLIRLRISDDGVGMKPGLRHGPGSFGLLGMAERVRAVGGQLRIDAAAAVPMPPALDFEAISRGVRVELGHSLQTVLDALEGSVAVLDPAGIVRLVNRGWREFSERHGGTPEAAWWVGASYLEVCRASAATEPSALAVAAGLGEVLAGTRDQFTCEYPCELPCGAGWFRMHAASVTGDIVIVHHVDLGRQFGPVDEPLHDAIGALPAP